MPKILNAGLLIRHAPVPHHWQRRFSKSLSTTKPRREVLAQQLYVPFRFCTNAGCYSITARDDANTTLDQIVNSSI